MATNATSAMLNDDSPPLDFHIITKYSKYAWIPLSSSEPTFISMT